MSQGVAAMMSGDLISARSLAQGKGEHPGDAEERIRLGATAPPTPGGLAGGLASTTAVAGTGTGSAVRAAPAGAARAIRPSAAAPSALSTPDRTQAMAASAAAGTRLAAGAAAAPEQRQAARQQAWQAWSQASAAGTAGDRQEAVHHAVDALGHALDSGDPLLAMRAAGIYEQAVAHESSAALADGIPPPLRPAADGMAAAGVAAGRDQLADQVRTLGPGPVGVPPITPARDRGEQERCAERADHALRMLDAPERGPTDRRMATVRAAMIDAIRSGDPQLQQRARIQVLETAYDAAQLPADEVMTAGALRDAMVALSVAAPLQPQPLGARDQARVPAPATIALSASSEEYRSALGQAEDGNRLLGGMRHPASALVRATVVGGTAALAIARSGGSAGQISESGEQIERAAAAALRLEAGEAEAPVVQIEVAEAMVQAAHGYAQASAFHHAYAQELAAAAQAEGAPEQRSGLDRQSAHHRSQSEQLRTRSTATLRSAHHLAGQALSSARTDAAISGGEAPVQVLGVVQARAQLLLGGARRGAAAAAVPGGDGAGP